MSVSSFDRSHARELLRTAAADLAALDRQRSALQLSRDLALKYARDCGVSWVDMQADSGLSVGAVRGALSRVERQWGGDVREFLE